MPELGEIELLKIPIMFAVGYRGNCLSVSGAVLFTQPVLGVLQVGQQSRVVRAGQMIFFQKHHFSEEKDAIINVIWYNTSGWLQILTHASDSRMKTNRTYF